MATFLMVAVREQVPLICSSYTPATLCSRLLFVTSLIVFSL